MSRILRRPMFRGGRVDSRGTGIASGLGYEKGGRVGYFQDQKGGVVLGKDLIANNIFSGTPRSKDYIEKQQFYKKYVPKTLEDITADYNKLMQQKEDDLLMTMGIDDYSGFQNTVAEDLDYYRDPEGGMKKYFHDAKAKDDAARKEAAKYDVTIEEVINNQPTEGETREEFEERIRRENAEELQALIDSRMSKGTPEEEIEKNKKIFQKAYGSGRVDDASTMALSFASKALKEGATVKSAFGEFFEDESKRPSESKKYKDAATTAAINAYLTGQTSFKKFEDELGLYSKKLSMKTKADKEALEDMTLAQIGGATRNQGTSASAKRKSDAQAWLDNRRDKLGAKYVNETNSKKVPVEELFKEENVGEFFLDQQTGEFFEIIRLEDGTIGKARRG